MGSTDLFPGEVVDRMVVLLYVSIIFTVSLVKSQKKEISDEELHNIHKPTGLDLKSAFRCGLFFPSESEKLPVAPLFIFNSSWPAPECPNGDQSRYVGFCTSLWNKILKYIVYTNPSIKKERAPFVGPKSKKFPSGLEIGMYTNYCGNTNWVD